MWEGKICSPGPTALPRRKGTTAPKLFTAETELGETLPRPRMPKSLRQLYGNSADAECGVMFFFHRARTVDAFLQSVEFRALQRGWFGTNAAVGDMPGKFESRCFKKTNFVLALRRLWLAADRPICQLCLQEAQAREKEGLPKALAKHCRRPTP